MQKMPLVAFMEINVALQEGVTIQGLGKCSNIIFSDVIYNLAQQETSELVILISLSC